VTARFAEAYSAIRDCTSPQQAPLCCCCYAPVWAHYLFAIAVIEPCSDVPDRLQTMRPQVRRRNSADRRDRAQLPGSAAAPPAGQCVTAMADSIRRRAWRNLMISAINAGLEQNLFTLVPDDNRWPSPITHFGLEIRGPLFRFTLPNDIPVLAYVDRLSWGELCVAAAHPTPDSERWIFAWPRNFLSGEAARAVQQCDPPHPVKSRPLPPHLCYSTSGPRRCW
jgi:hypothetical protein